MAPLLVGILAGSLSVSMVNTALPTIAADAALADATRAWVVDAYPLAMAVSVILAARLGDRLGRRKVLVVGLVGHAASNLIIVLAPTVETLIVGRVVGGAMGALIVANVVSTIAVVYEGRDRTIANGLWVATFGASNAVGPVVGGVVTQSVGWPGVFALCVPIALVGAALAPALVPESRTATTPDWDWLSVVLSAVSLGAIVFGIAHIGDAPGVGAGSLVGGTIALVAFIRRQGRLLEPLIAVDLFRSAGFSVAFGQVLTAAAAAAASVYLVSVHVQETSGFSPSSAGLSVVPQAVATVIGGVAAPHLLQLAAGAG